MGQRDIAAEIEIDAPASLVWTILADLEHYREWNPFTPKVQATLGVMGSEVVLHVDMKPGSRIVQKERLSAFDPAARELGWGMQMGHPAVLKANRVQRVTERGPARCHYFTCDSFSGLLVPIVMGLYGAHIQRGFDGVARGLKARAEALHRGG